MRIRSIFLRYLLLTPPVGYAIIFLGMIFEGDAILFSALFLTHEGFFKLIYVIPVIIIGGISSDIIFYKLGAKLNGSYPRISSWVERLTKPFDEHLKVRPFHTIFLSKFTYGLHHAILLRAGMLKLDFDEFLRIDLPAAFAWMLIVGGLGYAGSASLVIVRHYLRFAEVSLLIALLFFTLFWHLIAGFFRKKL